MALLELRSITKEYGEEGSKTIALHGVSFAIEQGEFVAIMGPSGSGKSTLLHILGLLDTQTSGDYAFAGRANTHYQPDEIAHVRNTEMGFVFQSFNLLARTSVLDNVKLPLAYSTVPEKEWDARARAVIESVGLSHRLHHHPSQLSGGEKQRVAIARALVNNPQVLFADEPTGNLDSASGRTVMQILQRLNAQEKRTVILITHETYTAQHAARIIHIRDGSVESDELVKDQLTADKMELIK